VRWNNDGGRVHRWRESAGIAQEKSVLGLGHTMLECVGVLAAQGKVHSHAILLERVRHRLYPLRTFSDCG
jgi:hypothetical protein